MQVGTGIRPHFSCTVCHNQFDGLYDFKNHLESQEHELAYGIRLRNSMVGSYFCNCCHICVNTLLIWKSHIMGTKHMKIACAFSMAYSNFDFDKPAKIKDVGVLDQNLVVPGSLQRSNGRPSALVRPLDPDTVVIGVTDMQYTGPGLYHCNLCDEPFNEGNKAQHLCSTRHRCNVFQRWDMALYEEAISARKVGKPEYTTRCESIASEIFPVEQQVLSSDKKLLYARLMGTSQVLDDQYYAEELAQGCERQNSYDSQGPRGSRAYNQQAQQERYGPSCDYPPRSCYHDQMLDGEEPVFRTPTKQSLGQRALLRHNKQQDTTSNTCDMAAAVSPSPSRRVKLETVDTSPVHSRLGPRAASRHSTTPEQTGSKRYFAQDSPLRDTDHKDKRHRVGTPTPNKETSTRDKHVYTTPEPARNTGRNQGGKLKSPNSDCRTNAKKNQTNKEHLAGTGKDFFPITRKRGNSEFRKKNEKPLKSLTKEQIAQREKQIIYGKVTDGYQNYKSIVPKNMRHIRDPATPQKDYPYSKRCWDGLVRSWRRRLHEWDEPSVALNLRGAYTKNNKDLKESGLLSESGEVFIFTPSDMCRD